MTYTLKLTEEQMRVVGNALEEWFRLRMGQEITFCNEMAAINCDLSPENPNHDRIFDHYIMRRDHLSELMHAFFRIAFEHTGYLKKKTDDMLIAECMWDAIRCARGVSRWDSPMQTGSEPVPQIEKKEE